MHISDSPAVICDAVSKTYFAGHRSIFKTKKSKHADDYVVSALQNVTLVAEKGQSIGVLGRNGSGKSTLMRMIAGGDKPTSGRILVSAQPTLLSVSAALQPKLSGRQNIRLGLLAQGVDPELIEGYAADICEFADIGNAVNRPMNTYSSGMGARLKFAISTAVERDILLIDEALATGDAAFNQKARERMDGFLDDTGTIFLVTHAVTTVNEMCSRAIWLNGGEIIADGPAEDVTWQYRQWAAKYARRDFEGAENILVEAKSSYKKPVIIRETDVDDYFGLN